MNDRKGPKPAEDLELDESFEEQKRKVDDWEEQQREEREHGPKEKEPGAPGGGSRGTGPDDLYPDQAERLEQRQPDDRQTGVESPTPREPKGQP